ncbi:MAG: pilus assembly protein TadG-related protein [Clostridiales bacterium]|nr:pilus assembly protein TadG-related protein [Clostridiales bacterium]
MAKAESWIRSEDGDITVFVAFLMTALLAISALVVDIGAAYVKLSEVQNAADAAVLAAGTFLPVSSGDTETIERIYTTAKEYAAKNEYLDLTDDDISFSETNGRINRIDIDVDISIPTYFAKVVGFSRLNAPVSAAVGAVPTGSMSGVVPIGIHQSEITQAIENGQTKHLTLKYGGGGGSNGNFGFIFLDGSSTGGAPDFKRWMTYGYEGTLYVGQELYNRSGNVNSAVSEGCSYRLARCHHWNDGTHCNADHYVPGCPLVIMILVYENGGNADITVTGFAPFVIEGYTNKGEIIGSYVGSLFPSSDVEGDSFFGSVSISLIK